MKIRPEIRKKAKNADKAMTWWIRRELAFVYWGTPMLASHSLIFPINTPYFFFNYFFEKIIKKKCKKIVGKNREKLGKKKKRGAALR